MIHVMLDLHSLNMFLSAQPPRVLHTNPLLTFRWSARERVRVDVRMRVTCIDQSGATHEFHACADLLEHVRVHSS